MTVLVLSQELDRTTDAVMLALADRGVPVFRTDTSWFPQRLTLDAELRDGRWQGCLRTAKHRLDLAEVRSVWYRSPSAFVFPPGLSEDERQHVAREARVGLGGVLCSLNTRFVNHPHRVAAAYKPWQLVLAARCGLCVPSTVVSNSPDRIRAFTDTTSGRVVRKLFCSHVVEEGVSKVGHTRLLTDEDLADLRGIEVTAHQIQQFVDKLADVRAVVVGGEIFAVAIHASSPAARIDFRSDYRALRHEVVELPPAVSKGIREFMIESGLLHASLDFSVDRDGRFFFLEANPSGGQYGWLEAATGVPITAALADLLAQDRENSP